MTGRARHLDLTQGTVWKQLLWFSLPMLAGSLFQQLYATLDAVVVGRFAGMAGLAAIDAVYNLIKLPLNFFIGLSTGAGILISQLFGAKDEQALSKASHTAMAFALAGGALLSMLGVMLAPLGLKLLFVPDELYGMALNYVRISFGGLGAVLTYNIGAGILRAVGNTKTPFYYLLAASAVNTCLDLWFVGGLRMGVTGAALSTVIAQFLSAVLVLRALTRTRLVCRIRLRAVRFHLPSVKAVLRLGLPVALQSSLYPIANMMIQASINQTGTDNIAAWALCGKMDFLIWLVLDALGAAVSTFAAQNHGAGRPARIKQAVRTGLLLTFLPVALLSAALYFGYAPLGRLFLGESGRAVIEIAGEMMRFLAPAYFFCVFSEILSGAIRGMGQTVTPMALTLTGSCAFRIFWILLLVPKPPAILLILGCYPASWLLTALLFIGYYLWLHRKSDSISLSSCSGR